VTDIAVVPLTAVQERLVAEIRAFQAVHGFAPSLRELADRAGRATSSVAYQVRQLEAKGPDQAVGWPGASFGRRGPAGWGRVMVRTLDEIRAERPPLGWLP
jgi:hypothetical protein